MNRLVIVAISLAPALAHADPDADEAPLPAPAPAATAASTSGGDVYDKHFYIRAGGAYVHPLASSNPMELADVDGPASLAVHNGPIEGSGANVSSASTLAMTIGYRLPYLHRRLALETVLGLPFTVKFTATGTLANESIAPMALGIPTGVQPIGEELGEAKAAPPVLTLVYDILGAGKLRPYLGGGAALLLSYDAHVTNPMLTEVSQPEMSIAPAPGLVLQAGLDVAIYQRWYARVDVKFIALMKANAEVKHIQVRTPEIPLFDTVEVGTAKMSVWVNPLIIQAGIGTDF